MTQTEIEASINDYVIVRLTDEGERLWAVHWNTWDSRNEGKVPDAIRKNATLPDGRVRFQMHDLMFIFGDALYMGNPDLPFVDNKIWFVTGQ